MTAINRGLLVAALAVVACAQATTESPRDGSGAGGAGGSTTGAGGNGGSGGTTTGAGGSTTGAGGATTGAGGGGGSTTGAGGNGGTTTGAGGSGGSTSDAGVDRGTGGSGGATGTGGSGGTGGRGGSGGTGGSGSSALLVPAQGALFGAFVGTGTIAQLETTLGRRLAISHNFYGWVDDWMPWVRSTFTAGYIPLVTWETWNGGVGVSLDAIIAGTHDAMIRARAQAAAAAGQKFFLRWGHEMNGNWYPWDGFHNGASAAASAKYIAAYRHIHDLFAAAGATNVLWVFSPNVDSVPGDAWNQWANYYPGDTYVDWMGFDGYNWGTVLTGATWRPFPSMTGAIYAGLAAKGKPIMIPETASAEQGGDKAAWIAAVLPALRASYPAIKALVWFHMNKETDWRVDSTPAARAAFVTMASDPYFNP